MARTTLGRRDLVRYVRLIYVENPRKASRDFHNLLRSVRVTDGTDLRPGLDALLGLFAESPPAGAGVYNHHDVDTSPRMYPSPYRRRWAGPQ